MTRRILSVVIFGATGMVGQGVLRECLRDAAIQRVITVGRTATGLTHEKLVERTVPDLRDLSALAHELASVDACYFCLGVSAAGMSEAEYRRVTYDLTLSVAQTLVAANPAMVFVYVSGEGTDSTERGRQMWARVKGATENAVHALPFAAVYAFRPGIIQPLDGITSRTTLYRVLYAVLGPLQPVFARLTPGYVTDTRRVGVAMLVAARGGSAEWIVDTKGINRLAASSLR